MHLFTFAALVWFSLTLASIILRQNDHECDVSRAHLELPNTTAISIPSDVKPKHVVVAIGKQNYTCSTGNFTSAGALSILVDISCLYGSNQTAFRDVQDSVYNLLLSSQNDVPTLNQIAAAIGYPPYILGDQYYIPQNGAIAPKFDFGKGGGEGDGALVVGKPIGGIPSPLGSQNIDWVQFERTEGSLAKYIFQVNTRGGQSPGPCAQEGELLERQGWNSRQLVHKLPPELLSYVFVLYNYLGPEMRQDDATEKTIIISVHTTIPAVCRYWRKLVFNTSALWTSQCAGNHIPRELTKLVLSRAGTTTPLDVRISITHVDNSESDVVNNIEHYRQAAGDSFAFILNNGGAASRWRSLLVDTNIYAAYLMILDLIRSTPMPSLQYLELSPMGVLSRCPQDLQAWQEVHEVMSPSQPLFDETPTKLKHIVVCGIPNSYLFGHMSHPESRLTALTSISITFSGYYPSMSQFLGMLAANPQLVRLSLDGRIAGGYTVPEPSANPPYRCDPVLSDLESLSITGLRRPWWALDLLLQLKGKAPNLLALRLGFLIDEEEEEVIFNLLVKLIAHPVNLSHEASSTEPYFPSITFLSLGTAKCSVPNMEPLFKQYSRVTELNLFEHAEPYLELLLRRPWLLPKLSVLEVSLREISKLKELVVARCRDGLPLERVVVFWEAGDGKIDKADQELLESLVDFTVLYPSETWVSRSY